MAEQNNVPKLAQIDVVEKKPFNNVISTATKTSQEVEREIAELLGGVFADFEGCKIVNTQIPGQPQPTLKLKAYFKPCAEKVEGSVYAVRVRGEQKPAFGKNSHSPLSDIVEYVNTTNTAKLFDLEDLAKELLSEFLIINDAKFLDRYSEELEKVVKVRVPRNWSPFIEEIDDRVNGTNFRNPYLVVTLDLLPLIAKMYGKKDEQETVKLKGKGLIPKDRYQYAVNIVKVINPTTAAFLLEIRRIDSKVLNELVQSIGYGNITGNIVMTRV